MNKASYDFYDYCTSIYSAGLFIDQLKIDEAYNLLLHNHRNVVIFGNGGSASIADHFCCDFVKGVRTDTHFKPKCTSLVSNGSLLTALANDISYEHVFSEQVKYHEPSLAIAVSSSGNSKNILNGLAAAKAIGVQTIALVGFDGGEILRSNAADCILHVQATNYGIVEDCHMMILHTFAQKIRRDYVIDINTLKL
jgi:D-sedoheptulose 7-phosphate isomerase